MKNWIEAARLRTLPLSLSSVFLASLIAKWKGSFDGTLFILACIANILLQILSNFANDYGDGVKGTDDHRIGPKRAVQSGSITKVEMKNGIIITVILTFLSTTLLAAVAFLIDKSLNQKDMIIYFILFTLLGVISIIAAMLYTMGKRPYGYRGMGDLFVFIFFGLVSVIGTEFLYTKTFDWQIILPASAMGFFSVAVLNLNNMRDIETDRLSNKNTLALRMGYQNAKYYQLFLMNIPFILGLIYLLLYGNQFPLTFTDFKSFFPYTFMLLWFFSIPLRRKIIACDTPVELDNYMKPTAFLTLAFAIIFGIGLNVGLISD